MIRSLVLLLISLILLSCGGTGEVSSSSSSSSASSSASSSGDPQYQPRCDDSLTTSNKNAAISALEGLFIQKDVSAIDRYWADPYLQHNPIAASGVDTFKGFMAGFVRSAGFNYRIIRTIAECDLVVVQGQYSQTGVIFDMFRLKDGKLMEHWDSDTNHASSALGTTEISQTLDTHKNRATIETFYAHLTSNNLDAANAMVSRTIMMHPDTSRAGDTAFSDYMNSSKANYTKVHHLIAQGDFVFALVEGKKNNRAYGFYDLFRLDQGQIIEYWNSGRSVPSTSVSGLPIF